MPRKARGSVLTGAVDTRKGGPLNPIPLDEVKFSVPGMPTYWELLSGYLTGNNTLDFKDMALTTGVAALNKVKPLLLNNDFTNKVYKYAAHKIGSMTGGYPMVDEIRGDLRPNDYQLQYNMPENRDLLAQYIYGNETGFKPSNLPTIGLEKYYKKYGDIPKYEMDSEVPAGDTLRMTPQEYQQFLKESRQISPGVYAQENEEWSPARPKDNLAGHMTFMDTRQKTPMLTTQDIWKFDPDDYVPKYGSGIGLFNKYLIDKESRLMEAAGKPYILQQQNPVKIEEHAGGGFVNSKGMRKKRGIPEYQNPGYDLNFRIASIGNSAVNGKRIKVGKPRKYPGGSPGVSRTGNPLLDQLPAGTPQWSIGPVASNYGMQLKPEPMTINPDDFVPKVSIDQPNKQQASVPRNYKTTARAPSGDEMLNNIQLAATAASFVPVPLISGPARLIDAGIGLYQAKKAIEQAPEHIRQGNYGDLFFDALNVSGAMSTPKVLRELDDMTAVTARTAGMLPEMRPQAAGFRFNQPAYSAPAITANTADDLARMHSARALGGHYMDKLQYSGSVDDMREALRVGENLSDAEFKNITGNTRANYLKRIEENKPYRKKPAPLPTVEADRILAEDEARILARMTPAERLAHEEDIAFNQRLDAEEAARAAEVYAKRAKPGVIGPGYDQLKVRPRRSLDPYPITPKPSYTRELQPMLFRGEDKVVGSFRKAQRTIDEAPKGKSFVPADQMSTDAYPIGLRTAIRNLKDNKVSVAYHGNQRVGNGGFTRIAGMDPRLNINEINQYIKELNDISTTKLPMAYLNDKGDIMAPLFTMNRKSGGGKVRKRRHVPYAGGGYIEGDEMDLSPAEIKRLRNLGYDFEEL